jgi:hypothetical protein
MVFVGAKIVSENNGEISYSIGETTGNFPSAGN